MGESILHLLPHQGVGGLQRFVIEVVRHRRMDREQDEIVLTERPLDVERDFQAPATPVHFLGLTDEKRGVRAARLADLAVARSADWLHAYRTDDLLLAAEAVRLSSGKLRLAAHPFFAPPNLGLFERRRLARALREAATFRVAAPSLVAPWSRYGAAPSVSVPGVDVQRFSPQELQSSWRAARLPDPATLLVGSLVSAEPGKGHDVLIEAAERRHKAGRPTALMLVGDGSIYDALRERSRGSDVIFVRRRVTDGPGFFSRIDALALHAPDDAVPMALIESLSCGRSAVVADAGGGAAELVGADAAAFVAPGDVDAIVSAFDRLAERAARDEIGQVARQRALERFSLGRALGELSKPLPT